MESLKKAEIPSGSEVPHSVTVAHKVKVIKKRKLKITKEAKSFIQFEVVPSPYCIRLSENEECISTVVSSESHVIDQELFDVYNEGIDDYPLDHAKLRRKPARSARSNHKKPHLKNRLVSAHVEAKELKRVQRLKQNWIEQKLNKQRELERRGLKKFGFDIYNRRSAVIPKTDSINHSYCHKTKPPSRFVQMDNPLVRKHVLEETNIPKEHGFLSRLVELQHRELSPEDYELLLLLDDTIAPKTVHLHLLNSIDQASAEAVGLLGELCSICMESYEASQKTKRLPCEHYFHNKCIDFWLSNSSQNCPLDGLAAFPSSL